MRGLKIALGTLALVIHVGAAAEYFVLEFLHLGPQTDHFGGQFLAAGEGFALEGGILIGSQGLAVGPGFFSHTHNLVY